MNDVLVDRATAKLRARSLDDAADKDLGDLLRNRIRDEGIRMRRARHDFLFHQDDSANEVYLLNEGIVAILRVGADGHREIYGFVMGPMFIIPPISNGNIVQHSAECLSDVDMYVLSRQTLDRMLEAEPLLARAVLEELGSKINLAHNHLSNVLCNHGVARVACMLISLHQKIANSESVRDRGSLPNDCIGITQVDLSAAIGMTPVYLNQILKKMKDRGIVELKSGKVKILKINELVEISDCSQAL